MTNQHRCACHSKFKHLCDGFVLIVLHAFVLHIFPKTTIEISGLQIIQINKEKLINSVCLNQFVFEKAEKFSI